MGRLIRPSNKTKTAQKSAAVKSTSAYSTKSGTTPAARVVSSRPVPQPTTAQSQATLQAQTRTPIVNGVNQKRKDPTPVIQPPPPSAPAAANDIFKALYDFDDSSLSPTKLYKDETLQVMQRDNKGRETCGFVASVTADFETFRLVACQEIRWFT